MTEMFFARPQCSSNIAEIQEVLHLECRIMVYSLLFAWYYCYGSTLLLQGDVLVIDPDSYGGTAKPIKNNICTKCALNFPVECILSY